MKQLLALIFFLFVACICFAQESITTPPEVKIETITSNPQRRKPAVVKDGMSKEGYRYIWGASRLTHVGLMDTNEKYLLVSLMAKSNNGDVEYFIVLTAQQRDIPIKGEKGSPILLKFKDGKIIQNLNVYDSETRTTQMSNINLNYNRYDVTFIFPISEEELFSFKNGLSKIRVILDNNNYDVTLRKDNISKFLLDEYIIIKRRLEEEYRVADDF